MPASISHRVVLRRRHRQCRCHTAAPRTRRGQADPHRRADRHERRLCGQHRPGFGARRTRWRLKTSRSRIPIEGRACTSRPATEARRRPRHCAPIGYDNQGVDLVTDVPLSSAAFAIGDLAKQKDKVAIFTGGASADITGAHCGPNHLHWVYDTWSMPHGVVDAAVKEGGNTWFFITADYAFGHSLQKDAAVSSPRRRQGAGRGAGAVPWHDGFLLFPGAGESKSAPRLSGWRTAAATR